MRIFAVCVGLIAVVALVRLSCNAETPVAKAPRSDRAKAKDASKRTSDGQPVHSFQTLIANLGTLCLNEAAAATNPNYRLAITTRSMPWQQKALDLLGVSLSSGPEPVRTGRRTQ